MEGVGLSKRKLEELYVKQELSCRKIGKLLGYDHTTVSRALKRYGLKLRSKSEEGKLIKHSIKYKISKGRLKELYWGKNLSPYQIAKKFNCSPSCIFYKMKKYGIPLRKLKEAIELSIPRRSKTLARSIIKYERKDFNGPGADKAYLIGFRLGDLHVRKNKYGETIYVSSATSKQEQLDLMELLFSGHGKISKYKLKSGCIQFNCNLNSSFDFLLKKEDAIPDWILSDKGSFIAFLAGYIDAEGHFGVYNNFAEFSVSSYDPNILSSICKKLNEFGIRCSKPKIGVEEGYVDKRGVRWNGTIYRLRITRKEELLKLINLIKSSIKHAKRFNDLCKAEENITERNKRIQLHSASYGKILCNHANILCK